MTMSRERVYEERFFLEVFDYAHETNRRDVGNMIAIDSGTYDMGRKP